MFTHKLTKTFTNPLRTATFSRKKCMGAPNLQQTITGPIKYYGQPTYATHPHLIRPGEVVPQVTAGELQERRQKLVDLIVENTKKKHPELLKHIIIIPSATKQYMSEKIPYVFRQNSDFLYLSGCQEPDTCLIISTTDRPGNHQSTLFMREKDSHSEIWDGPRTGPANAVNFFGVDAALPIKELASFMKCHLKNNKSSMLWYDFMSPLLTDVNDVVKDYFQAVMTKIWDSPKAHVHRLRVFKSPAEIALMQKSCDIASAAISKTIQTSKPGVSEHQIFAQVDYECRMSGAEFLAYPPVVAGGDRATIIHYINNSQVVKDGEMVLMDAGCEYHGYSSDITRTWPIGGKFSGIQLELYEAVLSVQMDIINTLKERPSLDRLFESMCHLLGKRLQEIGLIESNCSYESMIKGAYQFCPHHVSHYLGMDVHDTASIPRNVTVEPGMIVTVEPGVYINHRHKVPKEFQGLGIRIEDDVLITESGPVVLTSNCPKQVKEIEELASAGLC